MRLSRAKLGVRWLVALGMITMGCLHFANPEPFVRIMPPVLPAPLLLVYVSGACELAGGLGLLFARTRVWAAWGLVALYVAVFPANVHMALAEIQPDPATTVPVWAMWVRLPFQALFIAAAWWQTRPDR
jgi:uncharacterized membrane protein